MYAASGTVQLPHFWANKPSILFCSILSSMFEDESYQT